MDQDTFLYFAYGSNMLAARLSAPERCPSARSLGVGELPGYQLKWHKISRKDGSGKFDIVRSDDQQAKVFGVVFRLGMTDRAALDREEGFGRGYNNTEVEVHCGDEQLKARTYVATATDPALKTFTWYRALAVAGAKEHGLPDSYVAQLAAVPADEDPDRARHADNMALIGQSQP